MCMRRTLHIILALSLLLLSRYQLAHELTAHVQQADQGCEVCLFTGHLGHGAPPTATTLSSLPLQIHFDTTTYSAPTIVPPFRLALSVRGPPQLSLG